MRIASVIATLALSASLAMSLASCNENRDEMRPDMDTVSNKEHGLQSRDLREMTDKMAPDLLQIPQIAQNPTKVVVVMKPIKNMLVTNPTEDLTIYVARLRALLNTQARDRMAFVEEQAALRKVQGEELGSPDPMEDLSRGNGPPDQRLKPQYVLSGVFYEKRNGPDRYYLCDFTLTDIRTGTFVWEKPYEVKTLDN